MSKIILALAFLGSASAFFTAPVRKAARTVPTASLNGW
jgi:hypothetical protein